MIPILGIVAEIIVPIIIKLIDKFVPDNVTRKTEFKMKKKMMGGLDNLHKKFKGKTIEEIATMGKKEEGKNGNDE